MSEENHGMTGKTNASKGRENWIRTNVMIDPELKRKAKKTGEKLVDMIDRLLRKELGGK